MFIGGNARGITIGPEAGWMLYAFLLAGHLSFQSHMPGGWIHARTGIGLLGVFSPWAAYFSKFLLFSGSLYHFTEKEIHYRWIS